MAAGEAADRPVSEPTIASEASIFMGSIPLFVQPSSMPKVRLSVDYRFEKAFYEFFDSQRVVKEQVPYGILSESNSSVPADHAPRRSRFPIWKFREVPAASLFPTDCVEVKPASPSIARLDIRYTRYPWFPLVSTSFP